MKTIQLHLSRSARSLRLLRPQKSFRIAPPKAGFSNSASLSRTVTGFIQKDEDSDMAPKGQKFDLKTPKGTKDCERVLCYLSIANVY
jgi:hypothetical protein